MEVVFPPVSARFLNFVRKKGRRTGPGVCGFNKHSECEGVSDGRGPFVWGPFRGIHWDQALNEYVGDSA